MIPFAIAIYGIFLILFSVASFFALYQLWQFGYVGDASLRVIYLYSIGTGVFILVSMIALMMVIR